MTQMLICDFSAGHLLADAYEMFMLDRTIRRLTQSSLDFYADQIPPFINWCAEQGLNTLSNVRPTMLRAYLDHLQTRNLSATQSMPQLAPCGLGSFSA